MSGVILIRMFGVLVRMLRNPLVHCSQWFTGEVCGRGGGCLLCPLRSMRRLFRPERGEATTAGTCAVARGTDEVMEGSDEDKRTFGHAAGRRRFGV